MANIYSSPNFIVSSSAPYIKYDVSYGGVEWLYGFIQDIPSASPVSNIINSGNIYNVNCYDINLQPAQLKIGKYKGNNEFFKQQHCELYVVVDSNILSSNGGGGGEGDPT